MIDDNVCITHRADWRKILMTAGTAELAERCGCVSAVIASFINGSRGSSEAACHLAFECAAHHSPPVWLVAEVEGKALHK